MLQAMNTGHDGYSLCTLHANTPEDALLRLTNMLQMGAERLSEQIIQAQIASAVDLVVPALERMRDGQRRITAISEVTLAGREPDQGVCSRCFASCWNPSCTANCLGAFLAHPSRPESRRRPRQAGLLKRSCMTARRVPGSREGVMSTLILVCLGWGLACLLSWLAGKPTPKPCGSSANAMASPRNTRGRHHYAGISRW